MNGRETVRLSLPASLRTQLLEFRRRVWAVKSIEAVAVALLAILLAFLAVYGLDRIWDTPKPLRGAFLAAAVLVCGILPWTAYRWIWKRRRLDQLAMLLRKMHPSIGEQLLGIIELVDSDQEQARSRELCLAAVKQVAEDAQRRDLSNAVPNPRHVFFARLAGVGVLVMLGLFALSPAATANAWARYLAPWRDTPRYTFTMLEPLAAEHVVPHGEVFSLQLSLSEDTRWKPASAVIQFGTADPMRAQRVGDRFEFECPPQLASTPLQIRVGDYSQRVEVLPTIRPELTDVTADIRLPRYLERTEDLTKDVRSGSATLVAGSQAKIRATASRALDAATMNANALSVAGDGFMSDWVPVAEDQRWSIAWQDHLGLAGPKPFTLVVNERVDEAPTLTCEGLPRQRVVLDAESLPFSVRCADDFGVKRVGIEWKGFDTSLGAKTAAGEKLLGAGSPTSEELSLEGVFSAKTLGISPQPIQIRMFAEDYLPDRERVYSPVYTLYVLSPEDHAIWLTDQLSKWHRHSLEVRDRELQLYEKNKQLRAMEVAELDDATTRKDIQRQAAEERSNGRRLQRLTAMGEELVQQASRNDEFGVGHLEKWAEMLQTLKDISANRMPSVADLLSEASKAEQLASSSSQARKPSAPQVGQNRLPPGDASAAGQDPDSKPKPAIPSIVDSESSQQPPDPDAEPSEPGASQGGAGRLTLPTTTLAGVATQQEACPAGEKMDEAVTEQRELLEEFEKVADELNEILANLEGSTLIKRLKAVARTEYKIAGRLGESVPDAFGLKLGAPDNDSENLVEDLTTEQSETLQTVSYIMDDMQAYYERRRMAKFKAILDEMEGSDVLGALRDVSDELVASSGVAISQCEFWSDTFDRWAEDLVDPASGGT